MPVGWVGVLEGCSEVLISQNSGITTLLLIWPRDADYWSSECTFRSLLWLVQCWILVGLSYQTNKQPKSEAPKLENTHKNVGRRLLICIFPSPPPSLFFLSSTSAVLSWKCINVTCKMQPYCCIFIQHQLPDGNYFLWFIKPNPAATFGPT